MGFVVAVVVDKIVLVVCGVAVAAAVAVVAVIEVCAVSFAFEVTAVVTALSGHS